MKKIDFISWLLSILINVLIIFLISYNPEKHTENTVKVGLVSLESDSMNYNLKNEKNIDSSIKNLEDKKINEPKKENEDEKPIEIEEKNNKVEKKEITNITNTNERKNSLEELRKAITNSKPKLKNSLDEKFSPEAESNENLDRILGTLVGEEGLLSGEKNGTLDGKVIVKWNSNNKKPIFPDSAQKSGKNGKIILLLKVDMFGNVITYKIEKGSGVPDIDIAIEKVIGTWNIKLIKNNKEIGGSFYIHYNFELK